MPKKPQAYHRPQNLEEALRLLSRPETRPLAGGTELLAAEEGLGAEVVDLQALGLDGITERSGALRIGAMVRLAALTDYLRQEQSGHGATPLVKQVIQQAGPNTYRNAATVGGIVASRLADSEFLAALLVLGTSVHFADPDRVPVSLEAYLGEEDPPQGLIVALVVDWADGRGAMERVARTPADYPIVSVTGWQPEQEKARLAVTGIAARPLRLSAAEAVLATQTGSSGIEAAAAAAGEAAVHPGDFRGDAAYRAEMASVLVRRALNQLLV